MRLRKLLVANRGEIARRVLRAARAEGLQTVAVYSDADADAPFVREADEAVRLGPAPATESYLDMARVIGAAWRTGADAVHPGYGFLAENADFAAQCRDAGLVFVGPGPDAIRLMGSKVEARRAVAAAGVPVVPGYDGADASDAALLREAERIGFPLLVKASAGGGGKGMRICRSVEELPDALEAARREALKAFGDDALLLERLIERPRHIEVQVLGDAHGNLVHLFERECSIQRRHQKIVEEAPSPAVDDALRARLTDAALEAARAIGYVNAGTVETILAPDGSFYFLEMNTRLQVEHPVTEMVTGLDIVRLQLRVAQGEPLPFRQEDVRLRGHAIEVRLYAEDPAQGFLPQTGTVLDWREPAAPGLRIDSGVERGTDVGIHYDPMLAKVIAGGATRAEAARLLLRSLRELTVQGVVTNRDQLVRILSHSAFLRGETDTAFLERHAGELAPPAEERALCDHLAAVALLCHRALARRARRAILPHILPGWRSSPYRDQVEVYTAGGRTLEVRYRFLTHERLTVELGDSAHEVELLGQSGAELRLRIDDVQRSFRVVEDGRRAYVRGPLGESALEVTPRFPDAADRLDTGDGLVASMPGQVLKVLVAPGEAVEAGRPLVILESMKMETAVQAPHEGTVREVLVAAGDVIEAGARLIELEAAEPAATAD